ncbi:MAG: DUF3969 family protein [Erysipelotrichaceae bacterium]|nr:DUF3969 family protein [Erysipelotrichaceae bacterium]
MVIPKSFENGYDFETMLLTSILGTFVSLKEELISYRQAESYWLSDLTAEIFEELSLSREIISLIQSGMELKDMDSDSEEFHQLIDQLIHDSKELISRHYTEYDAELNTGIIN